MIFALCRPPFSYGDFARRVATVDVTWFNDRRMPDSLFEDEHSTGIQNSLIKSHELKDFDLRTVIVASPSRRREFKGKKSQRAFQQLAQRLSFYDYEALARGYE